jgi:hypothetical protein
MMTAQPLHPARSSAHRSIRPPRLVEVFDAGTWQRAQLEALRNGPHGALALVRINPTGRQHPGKALWVDCERVRRRSS